jgi:superfamily II DNA or RNA helicase
MKLRNYQIKLIKDIQKAWLTHRNVLAVLPTGAGKTVCFSNILKKHKGYCVAIAHRQELVTQISLALANDGVPHRIIGPNAVIKTIIQLHVADFGQSYYDPNATCAVAGVDTLMRRLNTLKGWGESISLWVQDEAHHIQQKNKWGKVLKIFPNAKGLGVTANTVRADGKGLGRENDGVMDVLIEGPPARQLIEEGYLSDYKIFAPKSDLNLDGVDVSNRTGDFNPNQLNQRIKQSHIIGDVVEHYLKIAQGKLGITFATNVETALSILSQFKQKNVPAEVISAKTPLLIRREILRKFKNKNVLQLINVDIFGEGFDLPAIEVVSMARPTESFNLFCQQFGRGLRILSGKDRAIIIDHVGNTYRHGLPDAPQIWGLEPKVRRASSNTKDIPPVKVCGECSAVYEAFYKKCPFCDYVNTPISRKLPKFVDGDLTELDPTVLEAMRKEVGRVDAPSDSLRRKMERAGAPKMAILGAIKQHNLRQEAQNVLREAIALWAGHQRAVGRPDDESYRRFYHKFGIDVLSAKALGRPEAEKLLGQVKRTMGDRTVSTYTDATSDIR